MPGEGPTVTIAKRLRVYVEPAGVANFGIDHTGTLGDFIDVPFVEDSAQLTLNQAMHNPGEHKQNMLDYQEEILGKKDWSLTFAIPFYPTGNEVGDGDTAVSASALFRLVKAIMGGAFLGGGTTIATGGWANSASGDVASATGNLVAGGVFGWADTAGIVHTRGIEAVTGNTVTLKIGLPAAPASGAEVFSGATYYFTQDPDTSLQFIVEGYEQQDRFVVMGGQGTVELNLTFDGVQTLTFTITGTDWLQADEAAGSATLHGTDLGTATYNNYSPIAGHQGRFLVQTTGTATYSGATVDVQSVEVSSGMTKEPITSPSGVQSVVRFRQVRAPGTPPAEGMFRTYFTSYANMDVRDAKTTKALWYQNGVTAGQGVAVDVSTVQFTNVDHPSDAPIASEGVTWKARLDSDTFEATASDMGRSPLRLHTW